MHTDKKADYYVGLDMGTGSLGGAVIDSQYHLTVSYTHLTLPTNSLV